jgi:hypothetical protein
VHIESSLPQLKRHSGRKVLVELDLHSVVANGTSSSRASRAP